MFFLFLDYEALGKIHDLNSLPKTYYKKEGIKGYLILTWFGLPNPEPVPRIIEIRFMQTNLF